MKNWFKELKVKCAINARTARVRNVKRAIENLREDIKDNERRIEVYKYQLYLIDGNQPDLFIEEK
jgi:hypothetical protein